MLYAAWMLMGLAMAATLYEPACVVLALLDSRRMRDTIATVTVAGGLASAVWVPLTQCLVEALDWRAAVAMLGGVSGAATAVLHARYLPAHLPPHQDPPWVPPPSAQTRAMRGLRLAYFLEQGSAVAATALLVTMLIDRGVHPHVAGLVLASSGVGKVAGRLLLVGRIGRAAPARIAAGAAALNAITMLSLLVVSTPWLYAVGLACGAAAGSSSVLRPLIVAAHSPLSAFASENARVQSSATFARALGPIVIGGTASHMGWTGGWVLMVAGMIAAAAVYAALDRGRGGGQRVIAVRGAVSASRAAMPTGSVASSGTTATRSANWFRTVSSWANSATARRRSSAAVGCAAASELLTTQAQGWISARSSSRSRPAASRTGVVSARVTMMTLVCCGFCSRISGVVKCRLPSCRATSRW
jgi:predicted MFS family arabinose efflux permease